MIVPGTEARAEAAKTHPDIKALETVTRRGSQGHHLRARVGDGDLEVAVGVLLLENDADGLLDVDEESPRRGALLVMRHTASTLVVRILERWGTLRVVAVREGLCDKDAEVSQGPRRRP